jgi:Tol biopolymer transport system component
VAIEAGQQLLHYRLIEKIGEGGMGVVWKAADTILDRDVAIKLLPPAFAADADRLARFRREAKVLASLNHPSIGGIHGLEEVDGVHALVLELVEGPTLAERIARGPIPFAEALPIARQIAEALEAAHEQGIIHRDLKPANVKVKPDGTVKLLDFGLAKAIEVEEAIDPTEAPTRTQEQTRQGVILGTSVYMSPEQACGKSVDKRTDIWSFGCVLFECVSGCRIFQRDTVTETLAAVLEQEPEWRRLPGDTPPSIRRLLRRCLNKDPRLRIRDIGDARIEIGEVLEGGLDTEAMEVNRAPGTNSRAWAAALTVAALAIGAVAGGFWINRSSAPPPSTIRQQRVTEIVGMEETPAVSPDGKAVAFVVPVNGKRQVFVRLLAKGAPIQITQEETDHSFPRWADESTLIYFLHSDEEDDPGSLWETLILSSTPPRLIGVAQGEADVDHTGRRIATFRTDSDGVALILIDRDGERAETVKRLPPGIYSSPRWSPDDQVIAFHAELDFVNSEIRLLHVVGGETETVVHAGKIRGFAWLPDGSGLVYSSSEGSTLPYPPTFSLRVMKMDSNADFQLPLVDAGYASYIEPDVTRDGQVVASRVRLESDIFRYPVDGSPLENVANAKRITQQTGQVQTPSVSPSGEEVAYLSDSGGHANIWIARVDGSQPPRQITDDKDPSTFIGIPVWSPRGDRIVYIKHRAGVGTEEWLVNSDGTEQHLLVAGAGASWSHDGEWLYYITAATLNSATEQCTHKIHIDSKQSVPVRCGAAGLVVTSDGTTAYFSPSSYREGEVWKATPVDTGAPEPLVTNLKARIPVWPHQYDLSSDDRWLAAPLKDHGTTNLWIISTEDGSLRQVTDFQQRSTTIGRQVSWSTDNKYIFAALVETDADIVLLEGALP